MRREFAAALRAVIMSFHGDAQTQGSTQLLYVKSRQGGVCVCVLLLRLGLQSASTACTAQKKGCFDSAFSLLLLL